MGEVIDFMNKREPQVTDEDVLGCEECENFLWFLVWKEGKVTKIECAQCHKLIAIDEFRGLLQIPEDMIEGIT